MSTVAVFGLGSMGYGIAKSILAAGHATLGLDVVDAQMTQFQNEGGLRSKLNDCAASLEVVVVVVLNSQQTQAVLFGEHGVVPKLKPGTVVVSCATVAPGFAREMGKACLDHGVHYLDAPISGGAVKAAAGQLSVMASGSSQAFEAARDVLDAMASTVFSLGDQIGAGSAMKAVNQMLAGVHIAAMAEALTFGLTQGVEADKFVEVITQCAGTSWMLEDRAPHIVQGDYTPRSAIDIWLKDLGIVLDVAKDAKFSAPITAAALQQYMAASGQGLGGEDDAAIAKVYARNVGIELPGSK